MNTVDFLRLILPTRGVKFVAKIKKRPDNPKGDQTIHYAVGDCEDAADKIHELEAKYKTDNVFYAMASYKEVKYKTVVLPDGKEFTYEVGRKKDNAAYVKSLWLDIDIGKPGGYQTAPEAAEGVKQYVKQTGMPAPMIISSGYGIHCYWLFTEEVTADEWEEIAQYQRAAWRHTGLLADAACDADCARVLRAVGSHNRKYDTEKEVRLVRAANGVFPAAEYKRILQGFTESVGVKPVGKPQALPDYMMGASATGNLLGLQEEYPPSFGARIVQFCKQIKEFSETGGKDEPVWYAALGVLKHCEDGNDLAHEWSSKHEDYDELNTQQKYEQWAAGPTTCARFRELNSSGCEGCTHQCSSPIRLGGAEEVSKPVTLTELAEHQTRKQEAVAAVAVQSSDDEPAYWPKGFTYTKEAMFATAKNADGVVENVRFARPLFYPVEMIYTEDKEYAFRMVAHVRGGVRNFVIPSRHLGRAASLVEALSANQMTIDNGKLLVKFMSEYMVNLQSARDEINTHTQFGWNKERTGFLLGKTLITADGEKQVMLGKALVKKNFESLDATKGDPQKWVDAVDEMYNRENGEPYQLLFCHAFGAILSPLLRGGSWHGLTYALTSSGDLSGAGKTTASMLALSIYNKQTSDATVVSDSTGYGVVLRASAMNNIPFLLDEVTGFLNTPEILSKALYCLANGSSRVGGTAVGGEREREESWSLMPIVTSNHNLHAELSKNRELAGATQARVFEVYLDDYPRMDTMTPGTEAKATLYSKHGGMATELIDHNYGVIGRKWISYVARNHEAISAKLEEFSAKLMKKYMGSTEDNARERLYYQWAACVLVGGMLAEKLGFLRFDMKKLQAWIIRHIQRMRTNAAAMADTPEDQYFAFMASMTGHLIVTKSFEKIDGRNKNEQQIPNPMPNRNPIAGRLALGDEKERPRLFVTLKFVKDYCRENNINFTKFRNEQMRAGLIRLGTNGVNMATGAVKIAIGKGASGFNHLGNPWCLEFEAGPAATRFAPVEGEEPVKAEVVAIA